MKHDFEQRKQNRIANAEKQVEKNKKESERLYNESTKMASFIPMGQPILIGHHSEKADRRYRQKISDKMGKSIEADKKAEYYANKADSIKSNDAIFSDDPEAIEKLEQKIEEAEKKQEFMKAANKCLRKNDREGFLKLEHASPEQWEKLMKNKARWGVGFAQYSLSNNSANIRRMKERLSQLEKTAALKTEEVEINGVQVIQNVEANRLQLKFPDIPGEAVRKALKKSYGFRWSPSQGVWQRHLNNAGMYAAKCFLKEYESLKGESGENKNG